MLQSQAKLLNGHYVEPDSWPIGELITRDRDTYTDSGWPGCDYRIPSGPFDVQLGINIQITGRKSIPTTSCNWKTRIKIEFVGDCEPSTFMGGYVYTDNPLI